MAAVQPTAAMKTTLLAAPLPLAATLAAAQPAERPQDRWDLGDLYPSVDAWQQDAARLESQLPEFARCKGQLGQSPPRLRQCLELQSELAKRFLRLLVYSSNLRAEDTGNAASLQLSQKTSVLARA